MDPWMDSHTGWTAGRWAPRVAIEAAAEPKAISLPKAGGWRGQRVLLSKPSELRFSICLLIMLTCRISRKVCVHSSCAHWITGTSHASQPAKVRSTVRKDEIHARVSRQQGTSRTRGEIMAPILPLFPNRSDALTPIQFRMIPSLAPYRTRCGGDHGNR